MSRYQAYVDELKRALSETPGTVATPLRRALLEGRMSEAPAQLAPYLGKVRREAWNISDEDVETLKRNGYTEDQIFEATAATAVGAALMRIERAMAVVKGGGAK